MKFPAIAILLLAGCGGGGAEPAPVQSEPVSVTMYGDSVQQGNDSACDRVPCTSIAKEAQKHLAGEAVLQSDALGGEWAEALIAGGWGGKPPYSERLKRDSAKVVSFNHGINDASKSTEEGYRSALTQLVTMSQQVGKVVILQTPNPVTSATYVGTPAVAVRVQIMRQVASERGAILCDHNRDAIDRGMVYETVGDGIHPNMAQYQRMGVLFAGCVRQAIAALHH